MTHNPVFRVFWLEPTTEYQHSLRRYVKPGMQAQCSTSGFGYHNANMIIGTIHSDTPPTCYSPGIIDHSSQEPPAGPPETEEPWQTDPWRPPMSEAWKAETISQIVRADPRWPKTCVCGYTFKETDQWQVNYHQMFEATGGSRDGERYTLSDAPVGAMWDATWWHDLAYMTGPDGISLVVKTPGGDWPVDQEANNCTRTQWQYDVDGKTRRWQGRTHYCWVRHGDPRTGHVHVDKGGDTCAAGQGSINTGTWHGFLHHGYLRVTPDF